jgi:hypothetical protein
MTKADLQQGADGWNKNMAALQAYTLSKGKFSWQMLWTGGSSVGRGSTCPKPIVRNESCTANLRSLCKGGKEVGTTQSRTMMYAFYPGGCHNCRDHLPVDPPQLKEDLANFLLVRGPYAYLGHGWLGCSHEYIFPEELNLDYGEPTELCDETAANSGIFVRDWTKATVQMDCNTYTPTITFKK